MCHSCRLRPIHHCLLHQVNGDSGNDVALFEVEGVRGCVVANAHPELQAWHAKNANSRRVLMVSNLGCRQGLSCCAAIMAACRR